MRCFLHGLSCIRALQRYTEALLLAPDMPVLRVNRALALKMKGEWSRVVEDCQQALGLEPQYLKASAQHSCRLLSSV